jgi:hypothetical protein
MPALRIELACILCQVEGELNAEAVTCAPCLPPLSLCWS